MNRTVAFQTIGCRLNQYETDSIVTEFRRAGYRIVDFEEPADCYIMNTCTVTDRSDRKSRNLIYRAVRGPGDPVVVVTGCFVDGSRDLVERYPGVTYAVGNDEKYRIFDLVDSHFRREIGGPLLPEEAVDAASASGPYSDAGGTSTASGGRFAFGDGLDGFHTRAMLKIQDGCDNFCSFCIIPFVRGRAQSRPAPEIVDHARRVIDSGAKELVLTGVNMGRYDDGTTDFVRLVERLLDLPGVSPDYRLRLSSIEPYLGDGLDELVGHERFAPHLHLCLQSGSDRVLDAMKRHYTVSGFRRTVDSIRRRDPDFNFTTDILVGFPGETEEEFAETLEVVKAVGFSHVHTFPYSLRTGTAAARLGGQVDEPTKRRRALAVREAAELLKRSYRTRFVGRRERLLVERVDGEVMSGYGACYVPIAVTGAAASAKNRFVEVTVTGIESGDDPSLLAVATPVHSDVAVRDAAVDSTLRPAVVSTDE